MGFFRRHRFLYFSLFLCLNGSKNAAVVECDACAEVTLSEHQEPLVHSSCTARARAARRSWEESFPSVPGADFHTNPGLCTTQWKMKAKMLQALELCMRKPFWFDFLYKCVCVWFVSVCAAQPEGQFWFS